MSGLATILCGRGFKLSGTDPGASEPLVRRLSAAGIRFSRVQDGSAIDPRTQLLIATAAVPPNSPELAAARRMGIPVVKYASALGSLIAAQEGIAVAGTHGKTTTTALVAHMMRAAGDDVGFLVGGHVPQLGGSAGDGPSPRFVVEACEYDRSFLNLAPFAAIITNVEADHLDVYDGVEAVEEAFAAFAARIHPDGLLVYNADCPRASRVAGFARCRTVSCSIRGSGDYRAERIRLEGEATRFDLSTAGRPPLEMSVLLPGMHNVSNVLLAMAAGDRLGLDPATLARAAAGFRGVGRRFEPVGEAGGVTVLDDYAHHPTEIRALISSARQRYAGRRLVLAFQPHQISRTLFLFDDFRDSLSGADLVLLADVYAARDEAGADPSEVSRRLAGAITGLGGRARHVPGLEDLAREAASTLEPGDVLVTVGAGDVHRAGPMILELL
jgi:UDP-N-acetylmuramate--alanine ligase